MTTEDVVNAGRIEIDSADLKAGDFEGGLFDLKSDVITTAASGNQIVSHGGAMFGPMADEVGGAFTVDDTASGALLVQWVYTAD